MKYPEKPIDSVQGTNDGVSIKFRYEIYNRYLEKYSTEGRKEAEKIIE